MCGIFGVVVTPSAGVSTFAVTAAVRALFRLSESRGKDASGVAVIGDDTIRVLKRPFSASELQKTREYRSLLRGSGFSGWGLARPVAVIGHSRLVTNGAQTAHGNNQPVIADGIVGVHNGIIANAEQLWARYPGLTRRNEVDTEVFLALVRHFQRETGSLTSAVRRAYAEIEGVANVALVVEEYDQLLLATNSGSLYWGQGPGSAVFASEAFILSEALRKRRASRLTEGGVHHVAAGSALLIDLETARVHPFSLTGERATGLEKNGVRRRVVELGTPVRSSPARPATRPVVPRWISDEYARNSTSVAKLRRCSVCILPETVPFADIDPSGRCVYCRNPEPLRYKGHEALEDAVRGHRRSDGGPEVLVPLSGGRDSCYALHYVKRVLGMNPIAYTYDWGMVTDLARRNASRMCAKLGVEHVIISADIAKKRAYIRSNVEAWLRKPDLGTVPLFMAGDKQFFYYAEQLKRRMGVNLLLFAMNPLERTDFKHGFCGVPGGGHDGSFFRLDWYRNLQISSYYARAYLTNPRYLNASLVDTAFAYFAYYVMPHEYTLFHDYIEWDEKTVEEVLLGEYQWETSPDTRSTWRIGDGTAAFYNYIYWTVAGFTENDTFRSNQIREGKLTREEALARAVEENRPRYESMAWYCQTIGVDLERCLRTVHAIPKLYAPRDTPDPHDDRGRRSTPPAPSMTG